MQEETLGQLQEMASWKTSRLISFDAVSSHIRCHFNELLVGLIREVRQLQALGYRLKPQLVTEVNTAATFYRCGADSWAVFCWTSSIIIIHTFVETVLCTPCALGRWCEPCCTLQVWHGAATVRTLLQQHCNRDDTMPEAHDAC